MQDDSIVRYRVVSDIKLSTEFHPYKHKRIDKRSTTLALTFQVTLSDIKMYELM